VLHHRAARRRDCRVEQPIVRRPQRLGRLLAEPRARGRRVDQVGEEDRCGAGRAFGRLGGDRSAVYVVCALRGKDRCAAGSDPCTGPSRSC
jgi:hypothetical protein